MLGKCIPALYVSPVKKGACKWVKLVGGEMEWWCLLVPAQQAPAQQATAVLPLLLASQPEHLQSGSKQALFSFLSLQGMCERRVVYLAQSGH